MIQYIDIVLTQLDAHAGVYIITPLASLELKTYSAQFYWSGLKM